MGKSVPLGEYGPGMAPGELLDPVLSRFTFATHAEVEQIELHTDINGDLWVQRDGSVPFEMIDCTSWAGVL